MILDRKRFFSQNEGPDLLGEKPVISIRILLE